MPYYCMAGGCGKHASYGVTSRTHCAQHKTPDMVQLARALCKEVGCKIVACYGVTSKTHCATHKSPGMELLTPAGNIKCPHGIRKICCLMCEHCDHGQRKDRCLMCGGGDLCQCGSRAHPRYDGWCAQCFHSLYPDDPRSLNRNDAELRLKTHLESHSWVKTFSKPRINCEGRMLVPDAIVITEMGEIIMIELDGPQHFRFYPHFHESEGDFHNQIERDLAKNRYARDQRMRLLRISYKEYKNLEEIVDDFLESNEQFKATNANLYNSIPRF